MGVEQIKSTVVTDIRTPMLRQVAALLRALTAEKLDIEIENEEIADAEIRAKLSRAASQEEVNSLYADFLAIGTQLSMDEIDISKDELNKIFLPEEHYLNRPCISAKLSFIKDEQDNIVRVVIALIFSDRETRKSDYVFENDGSKIVISGEDVTLQKAYTKRADPLIKDSLDTIARDEIGIGFVKDGISNRERLTFLELINQLHQR